MKMNRQIEMQLGIPKLDDRDRSEKEIDPSYMPDWVYWSMRYAVL